MKKKWLPSLFLSPLMIEGLNKFKKTYICAQILKLWRTTLKNICMKEGIEQENRRSGEKGQL